MDTLITVAAHIGGLPLGASWRAVPRDDPPKLQSPLFET
jgi:hypothetical protein